MIFFACLSKIVTCKHWFFLRVILSKSLLTRNFRSQKHVSLDYSIIHLIFIILHSQLMPWLCSLRRRPLFLEIQQWSLQIPQRWETQIQPGSVRRTTQQIHCYRCTATGQSPAKPHPDTVVMYNDIMCGRKNHNIQTPPSIIYTNNCMILHFI